MTVYTNRGMKWELVSSWWILLTFVPFGLASFIMFFYAGGMTGNRRWKVYGLAYLIGIIVAVVTTAWGIGFLIALTAWGLSIIHAFKIRPAFLVQLETRLNHKKTLDYQKVLRFRQEGESLFNFKESPSSPIKDAYTFNSYDKDMDSEQIRNELNETLQALNRHTPLVSKENHLNPLDGRLIEVNHASDSRLAAIPEIEITLTQKIYVNLKSLGDFRHLNTSNTRKK